MITYRVDDTIIATTFTGGTRYVRVAAREDIKGRPGFTGTAVPENEAVWGYDDQVIRVYARGRRQEVTA